MYLTCPINYELYCRYIRLQPLCLCSYNIDLSQCHTSKTCTFFKSYVSALNLLVNEYSNKENSLSNFWAEMLCLQTRLKVKGECIYQSQRSHYLLLHNPTVKHLALELNTLWTLNLCTHAFITPYHVT